MDFSRRSDAPEWMDTEKVAPDDFACCLADLATVNRLTLAHRPTFAFLREVTKALPQGSHLTLLDVGFGQGDMLRAIHDWATAQGFQPVLSGIDLNPSSAAAASNATAPGMDIDYRIGDVFAWTGPKPDYIISSLFAHHLTDPQLDDFIAWMDATALRGWFINDLARSRAAWLGFRLLSTLAGWHRFVRHDGPVSIARSFRPADWQARLGTTPARVTCWFPYRLCVTRLK
jgi:SAM-dependent methyltransferase